jgi:hypothetical protein
MRIIRRQVAIYSGARYSPCEDVRSEEPRGLSVARTNLFNRDEKAT